MIDRESWRFYQNSDSKQLILMIPGIAKADNIKKHLVSYCGQRATNIVDFEWADSIQSTEQSLAEISKFLEGARIRKLGIIGISYGVLIGRLLTNYLQVEQPDLEIQGLASLVGAVTPKDLRPYLQAVGTAIPPLYTALQSRLITQTHATYALRSFAQANKGYAQRYRNFWEFSKHYPEISPDVPVLAITSQGPTTDIISSGLKLSYPFRVPDTMLNNHQAAERMRQHSGIARIVQTTGEGFWITEPETLKPHFNIFGSHVTSITQLPILARDVHQFLTTGNLNGQFAVLN